MTKLYDVIIAGAGPVGLFLACELALARASVLVLERDSHLNSPWKSLPLGRRGLNTLSIEALYRRGLLSKALDAHDRPSKLTKKPGIQFGGHFAGIALDINKLELDRWKYRLMGPALVPGPTNVARMETTLTERAESLGVTIMRGHEVSKFTEDDNRVAVEVADKTAFHGRWLVGCDGGRSVVRRSAGIDFVGTDAKFTGYIAECEFDHPEKLKPGFHLTRTGMYIIAPGALYLVDFDDAAFDRTQQITREHLQTIFTRVSAITDVKITTLHLASSFTDRAKQANTYRKGRVLLAGDAAHIHGPLGAQGLNVGLGDAMNLGWKLAATIRREQDSDHPLTDLAMLDTYESERHPVGAWVLEWTRAQVMTMLPDLFGGAVQNLIRDLINTTDGTNLFIERVWGLSQRYTLGDGDAHKHPLVGSSAPDFELHDGSRLGSKLENGKGLFVDFENDAELRKLGGLDGYSDRLDYVGMAANDQRDIRAFLVRPDGYVAWVAEDTEQLDLDALKAALDQWFAF